MEVSKIKGAFEPLGDPKQIGLVPNKLFKAPCGAIAGGAFVHSIFTLNSLKYEQNSSTSY